VLVLRRLGPHLVFSLVWLPFLLAGSPPPLGDPPSSFKGLYRLQRVGVRRFLSRGSEAVRFFVLSKITCWFFFSNVRVYLERPLRSVHLNLAVFLLSFLPVVAFCTLPLPLARRFLLTSLISMSHIFLLVLWWWWRASARPGSIVSSHTLKPITVVPAHCPPPYFPPVDLAATMHAPLSHPFFFPPTEEISDTTSFSPCGQESILAGDLFPSELDHWFGPMSPPETGRALPVLLSFFSGFG